MGHVVSGRGIATDLEKIQVVEEARSFHCQSFVPGFTKVCHPITELMVKGGKFEWMRKYQEAFDWLKDTLCSLPVLAYPELEAAMMLDTDAANVEVSQRSAQPPSEELLCCLAGAIGHHIWSQEVQHLPEI